MGNGVAVVCPRGYLGSASRDIKRTDTPDHSPLASLPTGPGAGTLGLVVWGGAARRPSFAPAGGVLGLWLLQSRLFCSFGLGKGLVRLCWKAL